ncbi:MAG: ABC transporter permease [Armatimonadetes bacterium]|nr:ABC transporter permease [Armatimonadota bacterium]
MLPALLNFVRKDLLVFRSDRGAAITAIVMPVLLAVFLGSLFGSAGGSGEMKPVPVIVADEDQSEISKRALEEMATENHLKVTMASAAEAKEAVNNGKSAFAVVVPKGFGEQVVAGMSSGGERPKLQEYIDPAQQTAAMAGQGFVTKAFATATLDKAFGRETKAGDDLLPFKAETHQAAAKQTGDGEASRAHVFAGMGVQGVLFMAINLAMNVMRERRTGVWRRVRTAPPSLEIQLLGRLVSGTVVGSLSLTCVILAGLLTGLRIHGSLVGLVSIVLCSAAMSSAIGLAIASLGKTEEQSRGLSVLFVLTMTMLSGAWFPSFLMPEWVQKATLVVPARWAVDGLDGAIWRDIGLSGVMVASGVTLVFGAVFFAFSIWRFRTLERAA